MAFRQFSRRDASKKSSKMSAHVGGAQRWFDRRSAKPGNAGWRLVLGLGLEPCTPEDEQGVLFEELPRLGHDGDTDWDVRRELVVLAAFGDQEPIGVGQEKFAGALAVVGLRCRLQLLDGTAAVEDPGRLEDFVGSDRTVWRKGHDGSGDRAAGLVAIDPLGG